MATSSLRGGGSGAHGQGAAASALTPWRPAQPGFLDNRLRDIEQVVDTVFETADGGGSGELWHMVFFVFVALVLWWLGRGLLRVLCEFCQCGGGDGMSDK